MNAIQTIGNETTCFIIHCQNYISHDYNLMCKCSPIGERKDVIVEHVCVWHEEAILRHNSYFSDTDIKGKVLLSSKDASHFIFLLK